MVKLLAMGVKLTRKISPLKDLIQPTKNKHVLIRCKRMEKMTLPKKNIILQLLRSQRLFQLYQTYILVSCACSVLFGETKSVV